MKKHKLSSKLAAYSLAAGAAVVATNATTSQAIINVYDNGGAGWHVGVPGGWPDHDMITFKMDGTVVTNTEPFTGLQSLGQDDDSFTYTEQTLWWYGSDEKYGNMLTIGANVGYVAGINDYPNAPWDVGRLGAGFEVGSTPHQDYDPDGIPGNGDEYTDTRVWSDHAVTSTGGLGGWNFYFHGEWPFGGNGYIGLYADDVSGRHYGWAHIMSNAQPEASWNGMDLYAFAFETTPGLAILAGDEGSPGVPGDFTGEGDVDAADIDFLCDQIGLPFDPLYDLDDGSGTGNPDGQVDEDDVIYLVEHLVQLQDGSGRVGTRRGDFNLDGLVNGTDLALMKTAFGQPNMGYADGNANCDALVNGTDLAILKTNFGFIAPTGGGVPEPATLTLLALGATGLMARRRRD